MTTFKEDAIERHIPILKDPALDLLIELIKERKIQKILELGSGVGYSAIMMAQSDDHIIIDTLEKDEGRYQETIANIEAAQLSDRIHAHLIDIKDFKPLDQYDLIFVDAAKGHYHDYLEQFYPYLKDRGIFVFDNLNFHNLINTYPNIRKRSLRQLVGKIVRFRQIVQEDERFDIIKHDDIGDGVWILIKRST